ncbi:TorD/DmsD family molecular chaperone [Bacillus marinisedimentorum]|uniref:TorD/DmsD family molecular chaperone n=1 Tax=Bacillus marinisedimentorum TaxID=1821260 RepID=UPI0008723958|nr:molecular chaperone TorD family protein [Bacillus marinisedimentorum]
MPPVKQVLRVDDVLNIFYAREFAYDILRRFFLEEPSREYVKHFIQHNMIDIFPFREESEGIQAGIQEVKRYLADHNPGKIEKHYEDLHWDYTRMFIGPFETPASPWESVYVTSDQLLFQETTMMVRGLYKKYGYETASFSMEADDHIGLELDFMYHLNQLAIKSAGEKTDTSIPEIMYLLDEQQKFIQQHLGRFAPLLAEKVIEHADAGLYRGLAMILQHYLQIDSKVLSELLNIELVQN